jgi:hypothetical protein
MTLSPLSQSIRSEHKAKTKRRIYELPERLVAGIISYQAERRLPSEVAAVRELLDSALSRQNAQV